jgi:hypothetical protein
MMAIRDYLFPALADGAHHGDGQSQPQLGVHTAHVRLHRLLSDEEAAGLPGECAETIRPWLTWCR